MIVLVTVKTIVSVTVRITETVTVIENISKFVVLEERFNVERCMYSVLYTMYV